MIIDIGIYKKTIFIAGSGRSGTTWLMELINKNNILYFLNIYHSIFGECFSRNNIDIGQVMIAIYKYFVF